MILIAPYAKAMRNNKPHPKNWPHWKELISKINEPIVQVGVDGEIPLVTDFRKGLTLKELEILIHECKTWIAVDSFLQHYAWSFGKKGIAIFGQSDPKIFGHIENINMLKDRKYLREKQFWLWEQCSERDDCWVTADEVLVQLNSLLSADPLKS